MAARWGCCWSGASPPCATSAPSPSPPSSYSIFRFSVLYIPQNQEHFIEPWLKGKTKNRRTSMGLFVFINDVIIFGRYSRFSLQTTHVLIVYNVLIVRRSPPRHSPPQTFTTPYSKMRHSPPTNIHHPIQSSPQKKN